MLPSEKKCSGNRGVSFKISKTACNIKYISQEEAINIDQELFKHYKYSVDQLMELAGLSCAVAILRCFPIQAKGSNKVLVCCGPGNNGGDGLVCARHLKHFGFEPQIVIPQKTDKELYHNLLHQCATMDIPISESVDSDTLETVYGFIVDALFGFSFKPPIRPNFEKIIHQLTETKVPICSIDIPSGWDVESGCPVHGGIQPQLLISLTAPKKCSLFFKGKHYLGGRFVPPALAEKYNLNLPIFPGSDCCVSIDEDDDDFDDDVSTSGD